MARSGLASGQPTTVDEFFALPAVPGLVTVHRRSAPDVADFDVIQVVSGDCGGRLTTPLLPGFCVPVRELFVP
jgi:hypothetical protein